MDVPLSCHPPETGDGIGVPAVYVYWSAALVALVPPAVVTVTSTVPVPVGAVAVMLVAFVKAKSRPGPEVHGAGAGETGAGDRDRGAVRPELGLTPVTRASAARCSCTGRLRLWRSCPRQW